MRNLKKILFLIFAFMFATSMVGAASKCGSVEASSLQREAANVKTSYEEAEGVYDRSEYDLPDGTPDDANIVITYNYFKVTITNLTENLYAVVTNDYDDTSKTFIYDGNQTVSFDWKNLDEVVTFTIKLYASNKTGCEGETIKTYKLITPRLNEFYNYALCGDNEDYYLCQKYVTYSKISSGDFVQRMESYTEEKEEQIKEEEAKKSQNWLQNIGGFISDHKVIFIAGGAAIVVIAGVVTYIVVRKRRRDVI